MAASWGGAKEELSKMLKIHGAYTEGFYEAEESKLFDHLRKK